MFTSEFEKTSGLIPKMTSFRQIGNHAMDVVKRNPGKSTTALGASAVSGAYVASQPKAQQQQIGQKASKFLSIAAT